MTTTVLQPSSADTYISSANGNTNYSTNANYFYVYGTGQYSIIQFDMSSIPAEDTITAAVMECYFYNESGGGNSNVDAYRLKQNCVISETTFNAYSTGNNWQTAGALGANDYDSTSLAQVTCVGTTYGWISWNLTASEIQKMHDGTYSDYGYILRGSANKYCYFRPKEYTTNPTLQPKLTITHSVVATVSGISVVDISGYGIF